MRRSGQMGVPVIVAGDEVIIGFDRSRLARLVERMRGQISRPRLGALVKEMPGKGLLVGGVREGSPAAQAGLRPGDLIVTVDRVPVRTIPDLQHVIGERRPGESARLEIYRDGQPLILQLAF